MELNISKWEAVMPKKESEEDKAGKDPELGGNAAKEISPEADPLLPGGYGVVNLSEPRKKVAEPYKHDGDMGYHTIATR